MSETTTLACHDCKVKYWAGQRTYLYSKESTEQFLHDHMYHSIGFYGDFGEVERILGYKEIELDEGGE